jgi:hypothetical protein
LLSSLESPPRIFLSASAIGGYSQTTDKAQTEEDPFVDGFLGEVCSGWEQSSEVLEEKGIRRVLLRIGLVLSPHGGLLQKLVPLFKCFLGGRISHGQQWMSWVDLDDLIQIILFSLQFRVHPSTGFPSRSPSGPSCSGIGHSSPVWRNGDKPRPAWISCDSRVTDSHGIQVRTSRPAILSEESTDRLRPHRHRRVMARSIESQGEP